MALTTAEIPLLHEVLARVGSTEVPPAKEPNFFDVGGRGYLENPTSDLLALFMGKEPGVPCWLAVALLRCVPDVARALGIEVESIDWAGVRAEREVGAYDAGSTTHKRLDIVFGDSTFTVGIENKVFASTENNPFHVYAEMLEKRSATGKVLRCIVAPFEIQAPPTGWVVVTYRRLVAEARLDFGTRVAPGPLTKWQVFYQELLNHLEQLGNSEEESGMESQDADFVVENYASMTKVAGLLDAFAVHLFQIGKTAILERLGGEESSGEISTGNRTWDNRKVVLFKPACWGGDSELAIIYFCPEGPLPKKLMFELRAYVQCGSRDYRSLEEQFAQIAASPSWPQTLTLASTKHWPESKRSLFVLQTEPTEHNICGAVKALADLAELVHNAVFREAQ